MTPLGAARVNRTIFHNHYLPISTIVSLKKSFNYRVFGYFSINTCCTAVSCGIFMLGSTLIFQAVRFFKRGVQSSPTEEAPNNDGVLFCVLAVFR